MASGIINVPADLSTPGPPDVYAALVNAAVARAQIRAAAMQAANAMAQMNQSHPYYTADDFTRVIADEGLDRVQKP